MIPTKKTLVDQILLRVNGGRVGAGSRVHPAELEAAIGQVLNALLKTQYVETLASGESVPEGVILATYDNVPVTSYGDYSRSYLPAFPVKLPRNMGVYRVSVAGNPLAKDFIPLQMGQLNFVIEQRLMSDLLGQIGYEVKGGSLVYTKDLTAISPSVTAVTLELIVADFTLFTDYEPLPINADMAAQVVETVFQMYAPQAQATEKPLDIANQNMSK